MKKAIKLNWDDLRIFVTVARAGSNAAAAGRLNLDHTTVTRRIVALESAIGTKLIDRSPRGISITNDGRTLLTFAERIESETINLREMLSSAEDDLRGSVRLAAPEAFGTSFISPNIGTFIAKHPRIVLELIAQNRAFSLVNREADVVIAFSRPAAGRVVLRKLTDYKMGLYASPEFISRVGPINEVGDLRNHPFIWYIDDLIDLGFTRFFNGIVDRADIIFRSTSISAQQNAIAAGIGLGLLPTYVTARDKRLVRILPDKINMTKSYWMTIHPEYKSIKTVRAVVEFMHHLVAAHRDIFI